MLKPCLEHRTTLWRLPRITQAAKAADPGTWADAAKAQQPHLSTTEKRHALALVNTLTRRTLTSSIRSTSAKKNSSPVWCLSQSRFEQDFQSELNGISSVSSNKLLAFWKLWPVRIGKGNNTTKKKISQGWVIFQWHTLVSMEH